MRKTMLAAAAVAALAATSCTPSPLEIDLTVRRGVLVRTVDGQRTVTVTGVSACSGGSLSKTWFAAAQEPLDMFVTITQAGESVRSGELHGRCSLVPRIWSLTWEESGGGYALVNGPAVITVTATTNPGEFIDEASEQDTEENGLVTVVP